jgi:SAM-dependent methyltransferase
VSVLSHLFDHAIRRLMKIPRRGFPTLHSRPNDEAFDTHCGVETSSLVWLTNPFSRNFAHGNRYEACNVESCTWALDNAPIKPEEYWFVDVGCGKGRALLLAAQRAFPQLYGIEYSSKLCKIAQRNLLQIGIPAGRFEIICIDATEFEFPQHDLFLYLYNPFDLTILNAIMISLQQFQMRLLIAFEGQQHRELLKYSWLRSIAAGPNVGLYANKCVTRRD